MQQSTGKSSSFITFRRVKQKETTKLKKLIICITWFSFSSQSKQTTKKSILMTSEEQIWMLPGQFNEYEYIKI